MNREFAFFFPVLALILAASVLHAQVPVSAAAVANAFERPIVNKRVNALAIADTTASARNMASTGPRYNVAQFGAVGDGSTDDTAAIQAAYNTCWNGGIGPYGGVVEFPGTKTYVISSTINVYDQCKHEGQETNGYSNGPVQIRWNGPAVGATYSITGFTTQANNRATLPCGGAICATASAPVIPNPYAVRHTPYVATLSTTSTTGLAANQWVSITGCSTRQGVQLNNLVTQVAAVSTHSFTVVVPWALTNPGTYTDTCTATTTNVAFATDTNAHYNEEYRNLSVMNKSGLATANGLGVVFYFNSRVDTGTRIYNTQAASASLYGYYFANGGINSSFNGGWRCDGIKTACIYWRPVSNDNLGIEDGTVDNNLGSRVAQSGGVIFVDNAHCATGSGSNLRLSMRHVNFEVNSSIAPGLGAFTLLDGSPATCGGYWSYYVNPQLLLSLNNVIVNMATSGTSGSSIVVSPANDAAISMNLANVQFSGNATSGPRYVGLPALSRMDNVGYFGNYPQFAYSLPIRSMGLTAAASQYRTQIGSQGDSILDNLYQKGVLASPYMFSDVAFAAVPNGTTLYAGQIIAPPAYWTAGNAASGRYAIRVVQQTGTTGAPNAGATTCSTTGNAFATCTSATDLSPGQHLTIGSATNLTVLYIDATHPSAAVVAFTSGTGLAQTNAALSFSAPVLGLEMQMPTKSSAAPTTLAWSQGDLEQNSGATANGVAGWVNVAGGTPGTWAGIPLGDAAGKIAVSQVTPASLQGTDGKLLTAGTVSGTASPLCTDANGGATTAGCPRAGSSAPVASINVTGLTADTGGTLYAIPSAAAGWYNVGCYPVVTTPATTSSALPYCVITYTDEDTGATAVTSNGGTQMIATTSSTQNLPGTTGIGHGYSGNLLIHAAASSNITYQTTSYVSSGATPMAYALHLTAQYVGP
jgi:hypothetical protein